MGKTLYLDCSSGISGDMVVGALVDLGADQNALGHALASLPLAGFSTEVRRVRKNGIDACDFDVRLDGAHVNHDHDMAWLFGHEAAHGTGGDACGEIGDGHADCERHGEGQGGHDHANGHEHRGLADVLAIVRAADLSPRARSLAERIFEILAQGEAHAHGTTPDQVHFHEVGAVDSIVDVVAVAVCLDSLDVDRTVVDALSEGTGTVRCAHGVMPIPVPAVCAIAERYALPLSATGVRGELVTPTGAAVAAALRAEGGLPARYRIVRTGTGAGKRTYEGCAGVLRAMIVEALDGGPHAGGGNARGEGSLASKEGGGRWAENGAVVKLECDLDDCTGEALGRALELLMDAGAREVHYLPLFTKKGRPAYQLQVICDESTRARLEDIVFTETTTIGIRRCTMERTILARREVEVATPLGPMRAKEVALPDGSARSYPEHDSVAETAACAGVSYQTAYRACLACCGNISDSTCADVRR